MFGVSRPRPDRRILGCDVAGVVESVGADVSRFAPGDRVFGDLSGAGWGCFAEYVSAPEGVLAEMSPAMSFEQAAALPQAGVLALQGLRLGEVGVGQRVLVNGAGGGVGTMAIPIAVSLGAEVTGVDRASKFDAMRAAGASDVVDCAAEDFTRRAESYDVVLDVMARHSLRDYRRVLAPGGRCVLVGGSTFRLMTALAFGRFGDRKVQLLLHRPSADDLDRLAELFEDGAVVPMIDGTYGLSDTVEAFRRYGTGEHVGKLVITVPT
jgi:NADPH:quinone reductase-like Zn-dependent oxidoreductase